jgi:type VI secretion system protein ImpK
MSSVIYGTALRQLLKILTDLRTTQHAESIDLVRQSVRQGLDAVLQDCAARHWLQQPRQWVQYALVALADESVMARGDLLARAWSMRPLQLEQLGEFTAGKGFFERLDLLLTAEQADPELLHVYWLCLRYGFRGELVLQGDGALQVWLDRLGARIRHPSVGASQTEPPDSDRSANVRWRGRLQRIFSRKV